MQVTVETFQGAANVVESPLPIFDLIGLLDLIGGMNPNFEESPQRYGDPIDIPGFRTQVGKCPATTMDEGANIWKKFKHEPL